MEVYAKNDFDMDTSFFQNDSEKFGKMIRVIDDFCTNSKDYLNGDA